MKNIIFLFFLTILISCSKEEQERIDALKLSPPSWIQGSWIATNDNASEANLRFTDNNFYKTDINGNEISALAPFIIIIGLTGETIRVEEFNGPNFYSINIITQTSGDTRYDFTRITEQEMSWDNSPPLNESEIYVRN